MVNPDRATWLAYASLLSGMLLVGTYVGLSKPLTAAVPVLVLALLRFGLAFFMMLHWLPGPKLSGRTTAILAVQAFVGNFLFSIFMLYGVKLSSAVAAGLVMSLLPAVVAGMSALFLRERIGPRVWLAVVISLLGVALLNFASMNQPSGELHNQQVWLGHVLLFAAVCCEAGYVVTGKKLSADLSPSRNSALVNVFGLAFMLPLGIWQYLKTDFTFAQLGTNQWALLLFYAFAASVGSVWLAMNGLRHVPASRAGVLTIGLPIAAVSVGALVLNEPLTWLHGLAFAACAAALVLITTAPPNSPASTTAPVN